MPLGQVIFPFSGANIGGSHIATFELAKHLASDFGVDTAFLIAEGTPLAEETRRHGIRVIDNGERDIAAKSLRGRRNPVDTIRLLPRRRRMLQHIGGRDAIFHCNEINDLQSFGIVAKLLGAPVVYHHHALNRMIPPNTTLVKMADQVLCVSDICRRAVGFVPDEKVHTVLNPIDVGDNAAPEAAGRARRRIDAQLGIAPGRKLVGFVGNFWHRKRPQFFLEAAAALKAVEPTAHFVLFGRKGDLDFPDMARIAGELGIGDHVSLPGFLVPAEDNIAALDLLLAPAESEPFGRTLIEAALMRVPYVATDDAGHSEIGRKWGGGQMVPLGATPGAFAAAAARVLASPESVVLSEAARLAAAATFSPRHQAEVVRRIYQAMLDRRSH